MTPERALLAQIAGMLTAARDRPYTRVLPHQAPGYRLLAEDLLPWLTAEMAKLDQGEPKP